MSHYVSHNFQKDETQILLFPMYSCKSLLVHLKSRLNRTGGGVALFILDNLPFTIRTDLDKILPDSIDSAFVDISDGGGKIAVDVVYRPPGEGLSVFNTGYCNLSL
jgi:hypothetical protein